MTTSIRREALVHVHKLCGVLPREAQEQVVGGNTAQVLHVE